MHGQTHIKFTFSHIYLHIVLMNTNRNKCCGVTADTKQQASRRLCQWRKL